MPRDSQVIGSVPREQRDEDRREVTRGFMLAFAPFMIITILVVIFRKEHFTSAYKIFTNKFFLFNAAVIILFTFCVFAPCFLADLAKAVAACAGIPFFISPSNIRSFISLKNLPLFSSFVLFKKFLRVGNI